MTPNTALHRTLVGVLRPPVRAAERERLRDANRPSRSRVLSEHHGRFHAMMMEIEGATSSTPASMN